MAARRWIRLDVELVDRLADLSHAEFRAYLAAMTNAAWQPTPGVFASSKLLAANLDIAARGLSRTIPRLVETRRLIRHPGGAIEVRGWAEWQRPPTSTERVRAFRARERSERVSRNGQERALELDIDRSVSPSETPIDPRDIPKGRRLVQTEAGYRPADDPEPKP